MKKTVLAAVLALVAVSTAHAKQFQKGDWVLAQYKGAYYWFPGIVESTKGDNITIAYDDGERETRAASQVKPYSWRVGTSIECRWKGGTEWYAGRITRIGDDGESISVGYKTAIRSAPGRGSVARVERDGVGGVRALPRTAPDRAAYAPPEKCEADRWCARAPRNEFLSECFRMLRSSKKQVHSGPCFPVVESCKVGALPTYQHHSAAKDRDTLHPPHRLYAPNISA